MNEHTRELYERGKKSLGVYYVCPMCSSRHQKMVDECRKCGWSVSNMNWRRKSLKTVSTSRDDDEKAGDKTRRNK